MKKQIEVSKCSCGHNEIEIEYIPAGILSGRKASCFIRCKKCAFTVSSNDLHVVPSEKLVGFWNGIQNAKRNGTIWHPASETPNPDAKNMVFDIEGGLQAGYFLGVDGEKWCIRANGAIFQISPCRWSLYTDFAHIAFEL